MAKVSDWLDGVRQMQAGKLANVELTSDEVQALLTLVDDRRAKGHLTERSQEFYRALDAKLSKANAEMVKRRMAATG